MKNKVVFIDCTNTYPLKFSANNSKTDFIARGLIKNGWESTVIGRMVGDEVSELLNGRTVDGVGYYVLEKKKKVLISILKNIILQYKLLIKERNKSGTNILIIDTGYLFLFIIHILMAKLLKYKIAHIITEWPLSLHKSITQWIYLLIFGYFCDTILPISTALEKKISKFKKPVFVLPILADFKNSKNKKRKLGNYFTFCVHTGYIRNIEIVIHATEKCIQNKINISLVLILYGKQQQIDTIFNLIKKKKLDSSIYIKTNIQTDELNELYSESLALLAPMNPDSLQDKYRFSQKIAEYLTSGRPIITSNVGDIGLYLKNNEDVYYTHHSADGYYEIMKHIFRHKEEAAKVGISAYQKGVRFFHYETICQKLILHFSKLTKVSLL